MFIRNKKFSKLIKDINQFFVRNIKFNNEATNEIIQSLLQQNQYFKTKMLDDQLLNLTNLFILNKDNYRLLTKCESNLDELLIEDQLYDIKYVDSNKIKSYLIIYNKVEGYDDVYIPVSILLDSFTDSLYQKMNLNLKILYFQNFVSFYYKLKGICIDTSRVLKNKPDMYA